jgi:hypothetical protein
MFQHTIAFVFELNIDRSSASSSFQVAEVSSVAFLGLREINFGVPPASLTNGS